MKRPSLRPLAASIAVLALTVPAAAVAGPSPAPPEAQPLVADAGDSAYVNAGRPASFLGTAFGGIEPYTFAWSGEGVQDPANPTAVVFTDPSWSGTRELTLTVTDAAGAIATDDVLYRVVNVEAGATQTLHELEQVDTSPAGANPNYLGDPSAMEFPFDVPAGFERLDIDVHWANVANDYDAELISPAGDSVSQSGEGATSLVLGQEFLSAVEPAAGTWTVRVHRYATVPGDTVHVDVQATLAPDASTDPRATVDTEGPFAFVDGASQQLAATVGGPAGAVVAWDLDFDGSFETAGADVSAALPRGRHLVSVKATTADGFETRETTSVLVGTAEQVREDTVPFTVIGMSDSGINPYHAEFSAATYPDPEVLEATNNFTLHPCEYLEHYPCSAKPLPVSHGDYFPSNDEWMWNQNDWVEPSQLYWVPGTKIIGAIDAGGSTGATSGDDVYPILDDNGHGTGSASVATGNRYGYCPSCLIFMVEALDEGAVVQQPWVDITSHSHGYVGGTPIGHYAKVLDDLFGFGIGDTKQAVERGVNVLFAAGNGIGNAFDVPQRTYDSDQTGPEWNITVGALRRDNQGAIIGDGIPAHVSSWGDGNLPSACRTGVHGQCAFGGTSAATPYTAGTFGAVLNQIRDTFGDGLNAPRVVDGVGQVIAHGDPVSGSPFLADGKLTREELRQVMFKTAEYLNVTGEQPEYVYTGTYTDEELRYAFEGYGAATPNAADRATSVLLGLTELPDRSDADPFFQDDCEFRTDYYGEFDRNGDGVVDEADSCSALFSDSRFIGTGERTTASPFADHFDANRDQVAQEAALDAPITYYLHRTEMVESPRREASDGTCVEDDNEQYLDRADSPGDVEPCFDSRITSTVAAFRPKGIYTAKDVLEGGLPTGSTASVDLYIKAAPDGTAGEGAAMVGQIEAVLVAGDREIGRSARVDVATLPAQWTNVSLDLSTVRPAFVGEHVTMYFTIAGFPSWAYGHEGDHASSFTIASASLGDSPSQFGVTIDEPTADERPSGEFTVSGAVAFPNRGPDDQKQAGFHPNVDKVQVSVGDAAFSDPLYATVDAVAGTYTIDIAALGDADSVFVRAVRDNRPSPVASVRWSDGGTTGGGTDGSSDGGSDGGIDCEKAEYYEAKADKYDAKADEERAADDEEKAEYYEAKADKYREKADEERDECAGESDCEKAEYYEAKADKYDAKADEERAAGDEEKAEYYEAKADKYREKAADEREECAADDDEADDDDADERESASITSESSGALVLLGLFAFALYATLRTPRSEG